MNVAKLPPGMDTEFVQRLLCQQAGIHISNTKREWEESCCDPTAGYSYTYFFDPTGKKIPWYFDDGQYESCRYNPNTTIIQTVLGKLPQEKRELFDLLIGDSKKPNDSNMQGFILAGVIIGHYKKEDAVIHFSI
jgi:hypothetical protein